MPQITVKGHGSFEVPSGKRLVLALEDSGLDMLHRCGGNARCTTCRVKILSGSTERMTAAERARLMDEGLIGQARLSCQIPCENDMVIELIWRLSTTDYETSGQRPADSITPEPEWVQVPR
ncbi:MAG: (2Fe-2S)-binding protein [Anaerolineaceae bacterium]|nr:(2Fe-2S)-binding protein [Anaerolineaceae bacterium]